MDEQDAARADFADLFREPGRRVDLLDGAFAVARIVHPGLDDAPYRRQIAVWAEDLRERLAGKPYPMQQVRALTKLLFDELGLRGNRDDYYDPRNSCLNDVIDRRSGIPITLSVLAIAVAARADLPLEGVGFPGHFLVRYVGQEGAFILFDPFHGGEILIEEDLIERLRRVYGAGVELEDRFLAPVDERQIAVRMLMNLKGVYLRRKSYDEALVVVDRLLLVDPARHEEWRDQGMLLLGLQRYAEALDALERYLAAEPEAPDAARVRRLLAHVRESEGL